MLMVSIPITMLSAAKHTPNTSWGVPCGGLIEEETRAYFTVGTTEKWAAVALQPLSRITLKDPDKGKSSQWAEVLAVHMVIIQNKKVTKF